MNIAWLESLLGQISSRLLATSCSLIVVSPWVTQSDSREAPALGGPVPKPNVPRFSITLLTMTSLVQSMIFGLKSDFVKVGQCQSLVRASDQEETGSPNATIGFIIIRARAMSNPSLLDLSLRLTPNSSTLTLLRKNPMKTVTWRVRIDPRTVRVVMPRVRPREG